jgi:D-lactate dehydrogenase (cytochrome)
MTTPDRRNSTTQAIAEIRDFLGDRLSVAPAVREQRQDQTWNPGALIRRLRARRRSAEDRARLRQYQVPVIAYGTGTSLKGHFSAPSAVFRSICRR